ncbi:hypothetical protein C8R21_10251 [Nitrosospira multiformis]|uniref:Uncharacterized protein n=1 Tax=Nitrosospira multiformis TaxID=1231 RepID=A0A2T5IGV1_9PROT|nr:hypothetical protein C8R21_10251 [Nitrosospira multiformis]
MPFTLFTDLGRVSSDHQSPGGSDVFAACLENQVPGTGERMRIEILSARYSLAGDY